MYFSDLKKHTIMKNKVLFLFLFSIITTNQVESQKLNLLVGTYTNSCESKGIYVYEFNTTTADFNFKNVSENTLNPSYLTVSNDNKFVYSVNENGPESTVSAFSYVASSGKLNFINKQNSKGADPCYIINDDKNVIVANYSGGNIAVFGKNNDGSISESKQVIQHYGKGPNIKRQESPHVHMVHFSPDKKFVLSNDLGVDKVYSYDYNPDSTSEILKVCDSVSVKAGSGPRHLTFSNDGKLCLFITRIRCKLNYF